MAKDLKFRKLVENLSNRSSFTRDVCKSFSDMEDNWHKTLESGNKIDIAALKEDLKNDSGVIAKTVFANMAKTLDEVAAYLDEEFIEDKELPLLAAQGIFNETTKMREIPYYCYNTKVMDSIVDNISEDSKKISVGILDMIRLIENGAKDPNGTALFTKDMALHAKAFLDFIKENALFKPKSVVERSLSADYIYAGNAVIKQNSDRSRYYDYCKVVKAIPEKLRILANRFRSPNLPQDFFEMSENCRYLHLKMVTSVESITANVVAMAYNLKCIRDTFVENYKSLNDALIGMQL